MITNCVLCFRRRDETVNVKLFNFIGFHPLFLPSLNYKNETVDLNPVRNCLLDLLV